MSERTGGLYGLLKSPRLYEAVQACMGAVDLRREFASRCIQAKAGDRVIDIGCGPGEILRFLPSQVDYQGCEPNPRYVEQALRNFGVRGSFHVGYFTKTHADEIRDVDSAGGSAVLHHLDDTAAVTLFKLLRSVLRPGGRVVSLDNVYVPDQNRIAKLLIGLDRGNNVRTPDQYNALPKQSFDNVFGHIVHKKFPPYTYYFMQAS